MANLDDEIVTVAGMNGDKNNLTVDSQHNNRDQEFHDMYHSKRCNVSENTINGESQKADIDDIEWDKDHDWSISRLSYEKSSGEYLKMFDNNCDYANNLALSTHVEDECVVDCSERMLGQNIGLEFFVGNCFDAEYNGGAMLMYGMGRCGKSKLIANINYVVRSCGK